MLVLDVTAPALLRRFIDLPYRLYRGEPCRVPPLRLGMKGQLSPHEHPFYRRVSQSCFLATHNGRDVDRMAVFHNRKHNRTIQLNAGMSGYPGMMDNTAVTTFPMDGVSGQS